MTTEQTYNSSIHEQLMLDDDSAVFIRSYISKTPFISLKTIVEMFDLRVSVTKNQIKLWKGESFVCGLNKRCGNE